jgi:hypothetical protein
MKTLRQNAFKSGKRSTLKTMLCLLLLSFSQLIVAKLVLAQNQYLAGQTVEILAAD